MKRLSFVTVLPIVSALLVAGCSSGQRKTETTTQTEDQHTSSTAQPPAAPLTAPADQQIVSQDTLTHPQLPQSQVTESEANIPVTKTTTVITQNKIPVLDYSQQKADINRMSVDNFEALGFSPDVANRIVMTRNARPGGFTSPQDLAQIQGVDPNLLQRLEPNLGASTSPAQTQQAGTTYSKPQ